MNLKCSLLNTLSPYYRAFIYTLKIGSSPIFDCIEKKEANSTNVIKLRKFKYNLYLGFFLWDKPRSYERDFHDKTDKSPLESREYSEYHWSKS